MTAALGIFNAASRSLPEQAPAGPNMRSTLAGWFRPIALAVVRKQTVDFQIVEAEVPVTTSGVVQPLSARALEMKPEGQRAWNWLMIHATPDLALVPDDIIVYKGTRYRVMQLWDFANNGFVQYHVVNDYESRR